MIKVALPFVKASGRREGWWFHVTGLTGGRATGFRRLEGERLAAGECELPEMAVVILLRPVGNASSQERSVDVMHVDRDTPGHLTGVAYGLSWGEGKDFEPLRKVLNQALANKGRYDEACEKIQKSLQCWVGSPNIPSTRGKIAAEITNVVKSAIPMASDVTVVAKEGSDCLSVRFNVKGDVQAPRLICCAVPIYDGAGDPDFYFLCVHVPKDYEIYEEDPESEELHHHGAARKAARNMGYEVSDDVPVYDDTDARWSFLLEKLDWDTATVFNLEGNCA